MKAQLNLETTFFFCIFFCSLFQTTAQRGISANFIDEFIILDTTRLVVTYSLDMVVDAQNPGEIDNDIIVLEIGTRISKSYSYGLYKYDSIASKAVDTYPTRREAVLPFDVFMNYPSGRNTVLHRTYFWGLVFLYEDEIPIHWEILPERKDISGYSCQKAITEFRGRRWEAWFTNQIPVSNGPWKFHGLPGIIMQVSDDQNHFSFICIGISREKAPIKKWKWRYEKTTRENANAYMKRCADRVFNCMQKRGITFVVPGASQEETEKYSYHYNPIELK